MLGRLIGVSFLALGLLAQAPAPPAPAAQSREPQAAQIRVQVSEVIVPVTVTDEKDRFVSDLEAKDFRIFDEGKEQKLLFFSRERKQPVVVGFLLDLSNTNRLHWAKFQEAALELVWNLLPGGDRFSGYLITYGNNAEVAVNTTTDADEITDKIRKLKPGGGAAFFDAIWMACTQRELVKGEPIEPRRVLIVIGDGHDTASNHSLAEVLEIAQRNLVTVYGVSTAAFGFSAEGDANLRRICDETGGRVEYPLEGLYSDVPGFLSTPSDEGNYAYKVGTGQYAAAIAKGIFEAIAAIAGEVTTQYILRYVPNSGDSNRQFRRLQVNVNLPNVKVRARSGYYPYSP